MHFQKNVLKANPPRIKKRVAKDTYVKLHTFTTIPNDIQGCVGYFYLTRSDEKKNVYIMVENFASEGYVSINGKMEKFNLVTFKDMDYYLYSNGVYNLKVEFKFKILPKGEDFRVNGVITLLKGKQFIVKVNFIGECSC
ncbi:MAG: hypothetical protein JWR02_83 [Mucilaginibacter sp.]|nr:hypothetical protein [Mucilaginibacter sp.]